MDFTLPDTAVAVRDGVPRSTGGWRTRRRIRSPGCCATPGSGTAVPVAEDLIHAHIATAQ